MSKKQHERERLLMERRRHVADLLLLRVPQSEIAIQLGVSAPTITRDVRYIMNTWSGELSDAGNRLRARDAAELDRMEAECILREAEATRLRDEAVPVVRSDTPKEVIESRQLIKNSAAWERYSRDARAWADQRLHIKERRAKLLNLDLQTPQTANILQVPITFIQLGPAPEQPALGTGDVIDLNSDNFWENRGEGAESVDEGRASEDEHPDPLSSGDEVAS